MLQRILFFPCILFFAVSCLETPTFNRDNIFDACSEGYVPSIPKNPERVFEIDFQKVLLIRWANSNNIDGVVISKKQPWESDFTTFLVLANKEQNFKDTTSNFTDGTVYKSEYFRFICNGEKLVNPNPLQDTLEFSRFFNFSIEAIPSNSFLRVRGSQSYGTQTNVTLPYFDGTEIYISYTENENDWELVEDIPFKEFGFSPFGNGYRFVGTIRYNFENDNFRVKVNQYADGFEDSKIILATFEESFF